MVTLQILVLSFLVRIQVAQQINVNLDRTLLRISSCGVLSFFARLKFKDNVD